MVKLLFILIGSNIATSLRHKILGRRCSFLLVLLLTAQGELNTGPLLKSFEVIEKL